MSNLTGIDATSPSAATQTPQGPLTITIEFTDPEGLRGTCKLYANIVGSAGGGNVTVGTLDNMAGTLAVAFQSMTNCQVYAISITRRTYYGILKPPFVASAPTNIEDKVYLEVLNAFGGKGTVQIPAPVSTVFLSDEETVNPASTAVAALMAALITGTLVSQATVTSGNATLIWSDKSGNIMTAYDKGYYRRAKSRRRLRTGISTEIGG